MFGKVWISLDIWICLDGPVVILNAIEGWLWLTDGITDIVVTKDAAHLKWEEEKKIMYFAKLNNNIYNNTVF